MKTLVVVLGLVGVAVSYPSWDLPQPVQDTPEVATAKQAHLAALAKAKSSTASWKAPGHSESDDDDSWRDDGSWNQNDDGSWKDEFNSWGHQEESGTHWDVHEKKWTGPVALPPGYDKHGAPLQVLDTPEVSAEKSKHFYLYSKAAAKAAPPSWHN